MQKRIIKELKNSREILLTIIDIVRITDKSISIHIKRESLGINEDRVDVFEYPYVFQNRSSAKTIVLKGRLSLANNEVLKKAAIQSFELFKKLEAGNYRSMPAFVRDGKMDPIYLNKIISLRFLAGDILDAILKDQVPATWTIRKLWEAAREPEWEALRRILYRRAKSETENILEEMKIGAKSRKITSLKTIDSSLNPVISDAKNKSALKENFKALCY